jgi:hypothetical protein
MSLPAIIWYTSLRPLPTPFGENAVGKKMPVAHSGLLPSGSHGSSGLDPLVTSVPSLMPSPSVSGLSGLVPSTASWASVRPSKSVSIWQPGKVSSGSQGLSGSEPLVTSAPSFRPSPSESGLVGLVPAAFSWLLVRPSPSWSQGPTFGFGIHGSVLAGSSSSETPSPSVSVIEDSNASMMPSPSVSVGAPILPISAQSF